MHIVLHSTLADIPPIKTLKEKGNLQNIFNVLSAVSLTRFRVLQELLSVAKPWYKRKGILRNTT